MNLQLRCELLLAQTRCNAQQPQDSGICRREFENPQSFSKLRRGMRSKLGEQERRLTFSRFVVVHLENKLLHIIFIYDINHFTMKTIPRFRGPSLILLAIVHVLLFVAGLVAAATLRHGAPYVTPFAPAEAIALVFCAEPNGCTREQLFPVWLCGAFRDLCSDNRQPPALHGRPRRRHEHRSARRFDRHDRVDSFRQRGLDLVLARRIGVGTSREGDQFSQLPARRSRFRSRIRSVGRGSVRHKPLYAAASAVDGRSWNACWRNRRTLLVQPYRVPGKLFHSDYQIPGHHLDAFGRRSTDERSQRSARRACRRFCVGRDLPVLASQHLYAPEATGRRFSGFLDHRDSS